jgi:poly-gamma-glutamate capsule biosynthesis protein CapA/YwtB (metallophosphatase superfamily)
LKKKYYLILILSLLFIFLLSFSYFTKYITTKSHNDISKQNDLENNKSENPSSQPSTQVDAEPVVKTPIEVVLTSVGDVTLGTDDNFEKSTSLPTVYQNSKDPEYLFKNVSDIFKNDDITIANLETTFTTTNSKKEKQFNFKGDPILANAIVLGNIEGVNISNNHIYDYNKQGFDDTITTLKNYKINYFGEGNKWITTIKGVKFGFLGYQGWSNDSKLLNQIKNDIATLKAENCTVIINFHWGEERKYSPNAVQKALAHHAIDNGADLVIGHHPHVVQGIEKYKDRYIAYSLGNFCFGGNSNPSDKDTLILQNKFIYEDEKLTSIGIRIIPTSISSVPYKNDYKPTPLSGKEASRVLEKINKLNINISSEIKDEFILFDLKK